MFDVPRECLKLQFQDDSVGGVFDTEKATNYFYQIVGDQTWSLIHEFELVQPVLIDVSVAHEVHTAPDAIDYRISFTMGFDQDLPISKTINAWSEFAR
jgi:hypothetical protein